MLFAAEDLPPFPVQLDILNVVKKHVDVARELDSLELQSRKTTAENGWLQKAAEEMDLVVDDEYPFRTFRHHITISSRKPLKCLIIIIMQNYYTPECTLAN